MLILTCPLTSSPVLGKRTPASLITVGGDAEAAGSAKKACHHGAGGGGGAGLPSGGTGSADVEVAGTGGAGMAAAGPGDGGAGAAVEPDDVVATLRRLMATLGVWVEKLSE